METKGFFQFEIIINVLVSSFRFIWIPMLWVYGHYKYFNSLYVFIRLYTSETDVYRRQILTYKDGPRTEGVKQFYEYWTRCIIDTANLLYIDYKVMTCDIINKR